MKAMSSLNTTDQTFYEILEIAPSAGPMEIYQAYQNAKATYSPTSPALYTMFTTEEAHELLRLIEEAFQTLSSRTRRRDYDIKIGLIKPVPMFQETPKHQTSHYNTQAQSHRSELITTAGPSGGKTEEGWIGPVRVMRKKDELPAGFARTKFSVYEVKPEIEDEIKNVQECDGQFLQKIRLYKGVNLEQLSEEIKVGKPLLVALEANDIDGLPIAVFTRGFVIQFAKVLNLNDKQLAEAYMKYFKARKVASL
jgi:curved DNA-binding protein CbpA